MRLGYVLSRYPRLSETFILREMWELERRGHAIHIYPLRLERGGKQHARVAQLAAPVRAPGWWNGRSHLHFLRCRPGVYLRTLAAVLWHNRGDWNLWLGALVYWGKAVAIADGVERDGIEHVHAHFATHAAMAAYVVRRLTGVEFSFTVHAHDIFCHRAMLAQKVAAARQVVAISAYNRERIAAMLRPEERGRALAKIEVVHCGVELRPAPGAPSQRGGAAADAAGMRLLAIGSLQPYKGHRHLLAACALLRQRGVAFRCHILGGGGLEPALRRQLRALDLGASVRLLGPGDEAEVQEALAWAEVFVMPSVVVARTGQMEGIPVALMEAMAAGLAPVASRLSGIPELIEDGVNGLLVPPADAPALAAAVVGLQDGERRQRLGRAARQTIERRFEIGGSVERLLRVWEATDRDEVAA